MGHPDGGNIGNVSISPSFIIPFYRYLQYTDLSPNTQEDAETDQKPIAQNRVSK